MTARGRMAAASSLCMVLALFLLASATDAAVTTAKWTAKIGSGGANGSATISVFATHTGSLAISLKGLAANTVYSESVYRGKCSSLSTKLLALPTFKSTPTGRAVRSNVLSVAQATLLNKAGQVIRFVAGRHVFCGAFAHIVLAAPPTPTPTPAPTPTPTPSAGGTLIAGPYFFLAIPAGWRDTTTGDNIQAHGPGAYEAIGTNTAPTSLTLEELSTLISSNIKTKTGADPEQNEAVTLGGAPGRLLTYHFVTQGLNAYELDAHCVHNGRGYELTFANVAGTESVDRALFLAVLASFTFLSAG